MFYPQFLKPNDKITIFAPSAPIPPDKYEKFDLSVSNLRAAGFSVNVTEHVLFNPEKPEGTRGGVVSSPAKERAKQFSEALRDGSRAVMAASGGDMLIEMLEHVDFDEVKRYPKWIEGYSDPTSLLFAVTTKCDVATIYGRNGGGFDSSPIAPHHLMNIELLKGNIPEYESFPEYYDFEGLTYPATLSSSCGDFSVSGRLIGGCLDCLMTVAGTPYDGSEEFCKRYKNDGIVWYFDNFAINCETFFNLLVGMKYRGLFRYAKAAVFGRVLFPSTHIGMDYKEAAMEVLDIPMLFDADVGHVAPAWPLINGVSAELSFRNGKAYLKQTLK